MNELELNFLHEDDHLFILDKPSGIHSVIHPKKENASLAALLCEEWPEQEKVGLKPEDAGLVQRLDLWTSGCILGAKNSGVWEGLRTLLNNGKIEKTYLALMGGELTSEVKVDNWLGNPNRRAKKMRVYTSEPDAKERALPAKTHFQPIYFDKNLRATLVRVSCPIARRHQIRAHAGHIEHHLLGDSLYGSSLPMPIEISIPELARSEFFLRAEKLEFTHPETAQLVSIFSPLSAAFQKFFAL